MGLVKEIVSCKSEMIRCSHAVEENWLTCENGHTYVHTPTHTLKTWEESHQNVLGEGHSFPF